MGLQNRRPCPHHRGDELGPRFIDDVSAGGPWSFPPGSPHSIQRLQDDGCDFRLFFNNGAEAVRELLPPELWRAGLDTLAVRPMDWTRGFISALDGAAVQAPEMVRTRSRLR